MILNYDEIDEAEYHRHPALSVSIAKNLLKPGGPAKVNWDMKHGRAGSRVFDLGHAAHKHALGVGDELVDIGTDLRTKAAREAEAQARMAGKVPLRTADMQVAGAMGAALKANPLAMELLSDGRPEVSLFGSDEKTHRTIRGRIDWLRDDGILVDYKTTESASAKKFASSAIDFGYHMQGAWYLDLATQLDIPAERFVFIAQEKKAPYLVNVIELDADFLHLGRLHNREAIDLWDWCLTNGEWPGHPEGVTTIAPPAWAMRQFGEQLSPDVEAAFADFLKGFTND